VAAATEAYQFVQREMKMKETAGAETG